MPKPKSEITRVFSLKLAVICLLLGAILLLVGWLGAMDGQVSGWELAVFRFFNNTTDGVGAVFLIITFFGTAVVYLAICALLALLKQYKLAVKVFFAGSLAWITTTLIKMLEIRARPYDLINDVKLVEDRDFAYGFPSIHTAIATSVAFTLALNSKRTTKFILAIAVVLIGISRMVVGMHAPLDIVGGMGVGLIVGSLVNFVLKFTFNWYKTQPNKPKLHEKTKK